MSSIMRWRSGLTASVLMEFRRSIRFMGAEVVNAVADRMRREMYVNGGVKAGQQAGVT